MESIYDGTSNDTNQETQSAVTTGNNQIPIETVKLNSANTLEASIKPINFAQLENPELKLYVFPHLAGSELLPIPGYWTVFPAYPRTYYALPLSGREISQ